MPLYGFVCRDCGQNFQTLVRGDEQPECPACGKADLDRQLSLIASPPRESDMPAPACANGGPGFGCDACACNPGGLD